jgi:hypothetical protein
MTDATPEMLYAKRSIELVKLAINDLRHYRSDEIIIDNLVAFHDNLIKEYNEKYFPEPKSSTGIETKQQENK